MGPRRLVNLDKTLGCRGQSMSHTKSPGMDPEGLGWGLPHPRRAPRTEHLGEHAEDLLVDVVDAAGVHLVLELRPQWRVLLGGEEEGGGVAAPGQSGPAGWGDRRVSPGRAQPHGGHRGHATEPPPP